MCSRTSSVTYATSPTPSGRATTRAGGRGDARRARSGPARPAGRALVRSEGGGRRVAAALGGRVAGDLVVRRAPGRRHDRAADPAAGPRRRRPHWWGDG